MRRRVFTSSSIWLIVVLLLGCQSSILAKEWPQPLGSVTKDEVIEKYFKAGYINALEGIWVTRYNDYEIAILKTPVGDFTDYEYVGIVVASKNNKYKLGDVKLVFNVSTDYSRLPGTWYTSKKKEDGTTFELLNANCMSLYAEDRNEFLTRIYPKFAYNTLVDSSKPWPQPFGQVTNREQVIKDHFMGRQLSPIEGIWIIDDNLYEIAIIKNKTDIYKDYDYIGVVISSPNPFYKSGELKLMIKESSEKKLFPGIWFMGYRSERGAMFVMKKHSFVTCLLGDEKALLTRIYPKDEGSSHEPGSVFSGTGFFVANDLVLTNWHVVDGCKDIDLTLSTGKKVKAEVAVKDAINDLALLKVKGLENPPSPIAIVSPRTVKSGDKAYTIGFPMPDEMGTAAKVSEGIINSTSGMDDDPRMFQISIPVQPGNSGGPLLDSKGRVIGVVTSGINNAYLFVQKETIAQNVNYAMKINYLDTLLGMLLEAPNLPEAVDNGEMNASQIMESLRPAVVLIIARTEPEKEKPSAGEEAEKEKPKPEEK